MNKENNRSAAGLRRSAIAERIRIREEWSALKGIGTQNILPSQKSASVVAKKNISLKYNEKRSHPRVGTAFKEKNKAVNIQSRSSTEVLGGVVVLVDVGSENRALALRAALTALGATVVPTWNPHVTHLVWSKGGCREIRAKARTLATALVSPLWVEACAASNTRLPERAFPAATRASDLPSPRTLRQMLKKAYMENIPLDLSNSKDENEIKMLKLRLSSDDDTSTDKSPDTSRDTAHDKSSESVDSVTRENTASRRGLPKSTVPASQHPKKSRRKLFTQKEVELTRKSSNDESDEDQSARPPIQSQQRRDMTKSTRRLLKAHTQPNRTQGTGAVFRIVLTGMNWSERNAVAQAIRSLNGRIHKEVTKHTTHVLLGSCREGNVENDIECITGNTMNPSDRVLTRSDIQKPRTLKALCGAARGCRVLTAQWALDSAAQGRWLHHHSYVVPHLKKIAQKAHIERTTLGYQHTNYAYNVFECKRVYVSPNAEERDAATQLLTLCGATVQNGVQNQDGRDSQDGGIQTADSDVNIGIENGTVSSKWVFDSVAAARMRTTRRYVIDNYQPID